MSSSGRLFNIGKHPVVRSVGLYTFTNFLSKSVSFLLVFIFTDPRYITPAANGILSLFNNAIIFLKPVLMLGIIHSTGVDYFRLGKADFRDSFTTGFILSVLAGLFSLVVFAVFSNYLDHEFGFSLLISLLIPVIAFFTFCFDQFQNMLRSEQKPELFMKAGISKLFIELGLSVLLVVVFSWSWYGRVAGMAVSHFLLSVFGIFYFMRQGYLFGSLRKEFIRSELAYAGPVIALQMAFFAVNSSDKFILAYFSGDNKDIVGVYSIASVFASVVFTLHHALIQYVFPKIFSRLAAAEVNYHSIRKQFRFYCLAMAVAAVLIMAGTPVIYRFFINPLYHEALNYSYLFCIGYFFWSVSYFFFSFLLFRKDKMKILFLSLSGIGISLLLNYWFIARWSAAGGAAAIAVSCLIILLITVLVTRQDIAKMFGLHSSLPVSADEKPR